MSKVYYNENQIEELLNNSNTQNCSNKYISFTKECKLKAVQMSKEGIFFRDIFKNLGYPEYIYNSEVSRNALKRWNKLAKKVGPSDLGDLKKGRPKKADINKKIDLSKLTKDEELEYLRTKVAYLEEVKNYFNEDLP